MVSEQPGGPSLRFFRSLGFRLLKKLCSRSCAVDKATSQTAGCQHVTIMGSKCTLITAKVWQYKVLKQQAAYELWMQRLKDPHSIRAEGRRA